MLQNSLLTAFFKMPLKKASKEAIDAEERKFEKLINEWKGFVRMPTNELLKKVKHKVCVEKLFKPEEYAKLCKLEKKRIHNIGNNLTIMYFIGMPLPTENALRAKVGLPPKGGFKTPKVKDETVKEDDEEWKPSKPKPKQPGMINVTEYHKRKKFFTTKCLVDNEKHDPKALTDEEVAQFLEKWPDPKVSHNTQGKKATSKKENGKENKEEASRYPKRDVADKQYTEPEVPEDDHYLYCESCDKLYYGDCTVHGAYTKVADTLVKWGLVDRARRTCPDGISISQSGIRRSGRGAWADKNFPKDSVFGPYEGKEVHKDDVGKLCMLFEGGYAWEIYKNGKLSHYINGADEKNSNWLRYINCARTEEEQNVIAYQYKGNIYYRAYKDIQKGMELLVWYGDQYAEQLGISTRKIAKANEPARMKIFPETFHECEKCGKVFANEESFQTHSKNKHPDRSIVKRHKCDLCSYSSENKSHFDDHMQTHTKEKPFKCDICGKRFSQNSNLKRHIRIHTKETPYECDRCGRKFSESGDLRKHIRVVHDKIKAYVCPVCGDAFGRASHLRDHTLTHTGVRNFKCQFCGKRFTQTGNLRTHERVHTGEKPYKCDECSAAFVSSGDLRKHVITKHTKRFPHRCAICARGFLAPGELKKHQDAKH